MGGFATYDKGGGVPGTTMYADNVDFTGTGRTNTMTTDGQLLIAATAANAGGNHINVGTITSPLGTLTIGFSSPNITIDLAGGSIAVDSVAVQTGTSPVVPTAAGLLTFNGAVVAAGTNPVRSNGTGANTYALEVQTSQAIAATDATKIGLSNYDSSSFTVDANGFVTLKTTTVLKTLTGNSGGAISPTANNINTLGTGSITIVGSGSTLTTQLTGLTNHAVLVGAGTATITSVGPTATAGQILQSAGAAADPAFSTATYPSTTVVSQILYSSATNVVSGLTTANSAALVTTSAGVPVFSGTMTNGQMIIGSTGATPVAGTITSTGGTIAVTVGAGTLNLETVAGGFVWSDTSGAFSAAKSNGYFITTTATGTLPASPSEGDTIKFIVDTTNLLTITANTGQKIRIGTQLSAAAGTAVNTQRGDAITLVYRSTGTTWFAEQNPVGGWNVT